MNGGELPGTVRRHRNGDFGAILINYFERLLLSRADVYRIMTNGLDWVDCRRPRLITNGSDLGRDKALVRPGFAK